MDICKSFLLLVPLISQVRFKNIILFKQKHIIILNYLVKLLKAYIFSF